MRFFIACLGLIICMVAEAKDYSDSLTNEYEIRMQLWVGFPGEGNEYKLACRLDPESRIRILSKSDSRYIFADVLIYAAHEKDNILAGPLRGSCRRGQHPEVRISKETFDRYIGKGIHYIKQ